MKKMIQKSLKTFVIVSAILSCLVTTAFANGYTAMPRWSHWTMLSGDIEVQSDNLALVTVVCDCSPAEANSVEVTCELQQYDNSWKTIKTWTKSADSTSIIIQKYYGIAKNYSYRLKITARAYKDGVLLESVTEYFPYGYYN